LEVEMQQSSAARDALLRFYEAFTEASPGDMELFAEVFSGEDELLVVGTAYHEWVDDHERAEQSWGMEGVGIEPGDPVAWEEGDVAWAVDRPAFVAGDIRVPIRLTAVMLKEDGAWKIQHGHFSIGVPDEIGFSSAAEWSEATPAH
jgi:hypothetical protein